MNHKTKLYNLIFPIWSLFLLPLSWIVVIPANFLVDLIVIVVLMKMLKIKNVKLYVRKSILKVVIFGFLSDIIGAMIMLLPIIMDFIIPQNILNSIHKSFLSDIMYNPFGNIWSFFYVIVCITISSVCIYLFNLKFCFNNTDISLTDKRKIAFALAICTSPYLFLVPYGTL